jgi:hypothetical protein
MHRFLRNNLDAQLSAFLRRFLHSCTASMTGLPAQGSWTNCCRSRPFGLIENLPSNFDANTYVIQLSHKAIYGLYGYFGLLRG